jgi:membrane associated rhomboid family serine protease
MRRTAIVTLVCALVFGILASWLGPKMITYWYAPPVPSGGASAFHCTDAVMWAMSKLVWTQIVGSAVGAIVGLVVGLLLGRRAAAAPRPSSPPAKTG